MDCLSWKNYNIYYAYELLLLKDKESKP